MLENQNKQKKSGILPEFQSSRQQPLNQQNSSPITTTAAAAQSTQQQPNNHHSSSGTTIKAATAKTKSVPAALPTQQQWRIQHFNCLLPSVRAAMHCQK
jgi:hypothetical protein